MEGGLFLVFVIIAMIARAIEAMAKGKQQPPEQQRPLPRPQQRPRHDQVPADTTEDAAAAMIPDDLWEILTGRPKPQPSRPLPAPTPAPTPAPAPMQTYEGVEADVDEEIGVYDVVQNEVAEYERRRRLEDAQRRLERRQLRERRLREREMYSADKAPKVYSLEQPLPSAVARHAAFHAKIDDAPAVDKRHDSRRSAREWLFTGDDMKRAIVLQEVLGPPKGLE